MFIGGIDSRIVRVIVDLFADDILSRDKCGDDRTVAGPCLLGIFDRAWTYDASLGYVRERRRTTTWTRIPASAPATFNER